MNDHQFDLSIGESLQIGRFQITLLDVENGEGHFRIDSDWGDEEDSVRLIDLDASEAAASG